MCDVHISVYVRLCVMYVCISVCVCDIRVYVLSVCMMYVSVCLCVHICESDVCVYQCI